MKSSILITSFSIASDAHASDVLT